MIVRRLGADAEGRGRGRGRRGRAQQSATQHNSRTQQYAHANPPRGTLPLTNSSFHHHSTTTITTPCVPSHHITHLLSRTAQHRIGQTDKTNKTNTRQNKTRESHPSSAPYHNTTPRYHTIARLPAPHPRRSHPLHLPSRIPNPRCHAWQACYTTPTKPARHPTRGRRVGELICAALRLRGRWMAWRPSYYIAPCFSW